MTSDGTGHGMSGHGMTSHPTREQLAEHAEGLLPARDAETVTAHLAACPSCRSEQADLAALRAVLAADRPGPMPADLAARIDAALADAALADAARTADELSAVRNRERVVAGQTGTDDGRRTSVTDLLSRRRQRYRRYTRLATAAAGLVVVVGGSVLGVQLARNGGGTTAAGGGSEAVTGLAEDSGAPAAREVAPPYAGSLPRPYTREGFAEQVAALLRSSGTAERPSGAALPGQGAAEPRSGADATAGAAAGCAARLVDQLSSGAGSGTQGSQAPAAPLAVDVATWEGQPAFVVVLPEAGRPSAVHAYVVPRECPTGPGQVPILHEAVVPRP